MADFPSNRPVGSIFKTIVYIYIYILVHTRKYIFLVVEYYERSRVKCEGNPRFPVPFPWKNKSSLRLSPPSINTRRITRESTATSPCHIRRGLESSPDVLARIGKRRDRSGRRKWLLELLPVAALSGKPLRGPLQPSASSSSSPASSSSTQCTSSPTYA